MRAQRLRPHAAMFSEREARPWLGARHDFLDDRPGCGAVMLNLVGSKFANDWSTSVRSQSENIVADVLGRAPVPRTNQ